MFISRFFSSSRPCVRPVRRMWSVRAARLAAQCMLVVAPGLAAAVDLNAADAEQLQQVKGIGPRTAQLILEERQRGGAFESLQDLADRVKGIGPKKIGTMEQSGLTVGPALKAADNTPVVRGVDMRKKP